MTPPDATVYLGEILRRLRPLCGASYAGVGLLVYRDAARLPVTPLRERQPAGLPVAGLDNIVTTLLRYADHSNPYHDGFHLLSFDGRLTHLAQYFAPPIVPSVPVEWQNHRHGGRYRAAQYGSCLPDVVASGVLSRHYGPTLFVDGMPHVMERHDLAGA